VQTIKDIYKQNPKPQGTIEILWVARAKQLLRAGSKMGLLHINVAELELANVPNIKWSNLGLLATRLQAVHRRVLNYLIL
jgi:hypothetical protein